MSNRSWQTPLARLLAHQPTTEGRPRLAIVGIGHELRGDDAAGLALVRALRQSMSPSDDVLLLDAGPAPENVTGALRRFAPDLVLLVDAALLGRAPGALEWLDWEAAEGYSASSHTLPPGLVARYLVSELGCGVLLLGIQPACMSFGERLSPSVRITVLRAAGELGSLLDSHRAEIAST